MSSRRAEADPAERIERGVPIEFTFDGRRHAGLRGDTIASALAACGVRVISRSFKYHRPRGLLCCTGRCPNCLVQVDGVPNVRACMEPLRAGAKVRHQNAWPSLDRDLLSIVDRFDRLLPVGFYYKVFHRPRALWPKFEWILRRVAGLGRVDPRSTPSTHGRTRHLHTEIVVIGGGPAGCLAALEAASAGASVILVDDQPELGGHLRYRGAVVRGDPRIDGLPAHAAAARLRDLISDERRIQVLSGATAFGVYEGGLVGIQQADTICRVRARCIIAATGTQERPLLFTDNDLPGVMLGTGALRLARLHGVRSGQRAAVIVDGEHGLAIARELREAGIAVAAVLDLRPGASADSQALTDVTVLRARGSGAVSSLLIRANGALRTIDCDLVAVALQPEPLTALFAHDGGRRAYDPRLGEFVPDGRTAAVIVAGEMEGPSGDEYACAAGVAAGRLSAVELGHGDAEAARTAADIRESRRLSALAVLAAPLEIERDGEGKRFVCLCEDVTSKEIEQGIDEGFDHLELLKRYSTITMGPCQGRMCHVISARLRAAHTGQSIAEAGLTTARPPFQPVTIGALAGPHFAPVRKTAMHDRHAALGAQWMDMGDWKRPYLYTTVQRECLAVRERVAVIDVSTLGKLEVRGPDAGEFLDWLHPNRFSDLKVGRVRYRAMCDDSGIVFDDGTVARLGPDRFFLSTTTSAFEAVDQWLHWWLTGSARRVRVTNVTSHYGAINLAGPRSREVLGRVTALDVSREAMPYLCAVEGQVAGVDAVILRIGFVGELSYEIHVPADYAAHVWDALMDAGRDLGIEAFGVEAQRVLRLEKQHVIVGQDTDALSNPLEAGLAWIVKADKPDFVGRDAIAAVAARGMREALVGFEIVGRMVPDEGAAVVRDGRLTGRVTSAKWSDTLDRTIGLAIVPIDLATEGATLEIRRDGSIVSGTVVLKPFYDPDGARLRS